MIKKIIKAVAYVLLGLVLVVAVIYLYMFREQEIDVRLVPSEFEYCGKKIYRSHEEYKKIVSWLNENKEGWVLSFVSFVPNQVYYHPSFRVNVIPTVA